MAVAATEPGEILYRTNAMSQWEIVLPLLPGPCPGPGAHSIESWDIDIAPGSTPTDGVAYVAMGQGNPCGALFRLEYHHSGGTPVWTWTQEFHECPSPPPAPCRVTTPTTTDVIDCPITGAGNGLFKAIYSMFAVDQDVAIAVGYGAGIFRRDPATATWREISDHQYFSTAPLGAVVGNAAGKAWMFGEFGDMRVLDLNAPFLFQADNPILPIPPPRPFSPLAPQTGWRLGELWFSGATTGWGAGQLGRIVRWDNASSTWVQVRSACLADPFSTGALTSIVFGSLRNGIAVGDRIELDIDEQPFNDPPQIYMTTTGGQAATDWFTVSYTGTGPQPLWDVAYRPGTFPPEYWAVGENGFALKIYKPTTGPWTWANVPVPPGGAQDSMRAIEFVNSTTAVVVGWNCVGMYCTPSARAWKLDVSGTPTWTPLTLPSGVAKLHDVATVGTKVWVVGVQNSSASTVLYNANFPANPHAFAPVTGAEAAAGDAELVSIDAITATPEPEVMIGGLDGVLIQYRNATGWQPLDSDTAKHISAISMPVAGTAWLMGSPVKFENNDSITLHYP